MVIVGLDPGISTGFCRLDQIEKSLGIFVATEFQTLSYSNLREFLVSGLMTADVVVIERLPTYSLTSELMHILDVVHDSIRQHKLSVETLHGEVKVFDVKQISPGEWKPVAKARKWESSKARNQHERDAYCIAQYYVWTNLEKFL